MNRFAYATEKELDESSAIRKEMMSMTTEEISKEFEKLRRIDPNAQRTALFSMELQMRILLEKRKKELEIFKLR
ncbi:MAG: hypothetical protein IJ473_01075 [Alphaproteobacteria bacterium]|nr:hypothetical protein [Alphaproteobacteria bacterium]MBQ8660157.1 hypothetical protein [Alphaproteobacteria bacterium]